MSSIDWSSGIPVDSIIVNNVIKRLAWRLKVIYAFPQSSWKLKRINPTQQSPKHVVINLKRVDNKSTNNNQLTFEILYSFWDFHIP